MWERAGKPDGADFTNDAKRAIADAVRDGLTYEQVWGDVRTMGSLYIQT